MNSEMQKWCVIVELMKMFCRILMKIEMKMMNDFSIFQFFFKQNKTCLKQEKE